MPPPHYKADETALDLWTPPFRRFIFEAELLSGFSYDDSQENCALKYHGHGQTEPDTLVHMIRPTAADFQDQLEWVNNYAALRAERCDEILAQRSDLLSFFEMVGSMNLERMLKTRELLGLTGYVALVIHMRIKHALACRRPVEYSPQIQPMIPPPGHGSLPSGHATEAFVAAFMIDALIRHASTPPNPDFDRNNPRTAQLMRIAERIAVNRTVAGVHFPADSVAGMVLAQTLSEFFIARFSGLGRPKSRTFHGRGFRDDFLYIRVLNKDYRGEASSSHNGVVIHEEDVKAGVIRKSAVLEHLWKQAVSECKLFLGTR